MSESAIIVKAERNVAYKSPDHLIPWGTARDNSRNGRFNEKIYQIFEGKDKVLAMLDMGCSGGGFVKDCLDAGWLAVGIEGSDYSKRMKRAEWRTIPDNLFTCDITGNFDIYVTDSNGIQKELIFDLVTCWEVIEHIKEEDIAKIADNVRKHLSKGGLWIMSVCPVDDYHDGVNLHQTVQEKPWWINKFKSLGFEHLEAFEPFFQEQYIRSVRYGAPQSFHLILTSDKQSAPAVPPLPLASKLLDKYWYGTKHQKRVRRLILGQV